MATDLPLIAIVSRHHLADGTFYLSRHYSEAIHAAGGVPLHLPLIADDSYLVHVLSRCQGVLLTGSASDVDPRWYSADPHPALGPVHPLRDATDFGLLKHAERFKLPLLGICFGMQSLNVFRQGTLIQDIAAEVSNPLKHVQGAPREWPSHAIRIAADSRLAAWAGGESGRVNSHHHQALARVGQDLRAVAWTADGIIEAVEDPRPDRWLVAVQWHPEEGWSTDTLSQAIFAGFIAAAEEVRARAHALTSLV